MTSQPESSPIDKPYVYVIYAAPYSDTLDDPYPGRLFDALTSRKIPVSSEHVYKPDTTSVGQGPAIAEINGAAAVLIVWSTNGDYGAIPLLVDPHGATYDHPGSIDTPGAVLADMDGSYRQAGRSRVLPVVAFDGWNGDPRDPRLDEVEQILRGAIALPSRRRAGSAAGERSELRHNLSESADMVLKRSRRRAFTWSLDRQPKVIGATEVLLEGLSYQTRQEGVGAAMLRKLAQLQSVADNELLRRVDVQLSEQRDESADKLCDQGNGMSVLDPGRMRPLVLAFDELLDRAKRCAVQVSGQPEIHLRHLLAGAVLCDSPPVEPAVLTRLGTSATELPGLLLDVLRAAPTGDSIEEWEALLAVSLAGGFDRDHVDPDGTIARDRDDLEHGVWADMFAELIMAEATKPPLSIGLFGEWGSGKSTFMGLLRGEIEALKGQPGYVRDPVQIGFNAWHYADANLWASLGDEIFGALADALTPEDQRAPSVPEEAELLAKITEKRSLAEDAKARKEQAKKTATVQGERLASRLDEARTARQVKARDLVKVLLMSPQVDDAVKKDADKAWQLLGISDEVEQGEILAGELDGISQDEQALRSLLGWRLTWWLTAACLAGLLLTLAAHVFAGDWGTWLRGLGSWLRRYGAFSTFAAALASATVLAGRLRYGLSVLRSAAEQAAKEAGDKVAAARDGLRAAQARERAADAGFERASADLADLELQLAGLTPGRRMYSFLAERAASGDYTGQLGLVSIIRKDLKQLVKALHQHHEQLDKRIRTTASDQPTAPGQSAEPGVRRIDRIVLYIDDLDRCPPRQVVEVLQAVHLLLALDLFVVVVGVDPRWLVRSLREQYPGALGSGDSDTGEAVPADYLQKIFNIPFALPAFRGDRLEQLVRGLAGVPAPVGTDSDQTGGTSTAAGTPRVGGTGRTENDAASSSWRSSRWASRPLVSEAERARADATDDGVAPPAMTAEPGSQVAASQAASIPAGTSSEAAGTARTRRATGAVIPPQQLSEDELRFLGGLGPFIKTPRDAKRLFNVYRMIRSARDLSPASAFLGGEYQAAALLLAMLTLDPRVFARLLDAPAGPEVRGGLAQTAARDGTWAAFAEDLVPELASDSWRNRVVGEIPAADVAAWRRMAHAVKGTSDFVTLSDLTAFHAWAPHVRRFSYLVLAHDE